MFGCMHSSRKRFHGISRQYWHAGLLDDFPCVDLKGHVVHRASGLFCACSKSLPNTIQARKSRQQTGMKIYDFSG